MHSLYLLTLLVSVALCSAAASPSHMLRARAINSTIVCQDEKLRRNCAEVTLRCMTGKDEDGFEVQISPLRLDGSTHRAFLKQYSSVNPHVDNAPDVRATGHANGGDYTFVGKLVDLRREFTDKTCVGRHPDGDCSYMHSASTIFDLATPVPLSKTRLEWRAHIHVHLQCLITPLPPNGEDTLPIVPQVDLQHCEWFDHVIEFFPVPPPKDCIVRISLDSNLARQGYGYTFEKCSLSLAGQSIPLITNGRTQKSSIVEVTGRNGDGGSGLVYQLYLEGISPAQARSGSVQCEAVRCRSSIVATGDYSQCIQGTLPADFALASGRAPAALLNTAQMAGTRMQGDVKIYIPREGTSRFSPTNFMECAPRSGNV